MKNIIIGLAVALAFGAGGYFLYQQNTLSQDLDSGIDVQVAAGKDLTLREVVQSRHEDVEGTGGCDVRILYPQIDEISNIDSAIRESMNDTIRKTVKEFLTTNDVNLDDAATDFVTSCKDDLVDLVAQLNDPIESAQQAWTSEIGYDVKQNANGILSIGLSNYLNQGGAHPNITEMFLTFDVKTGNQLSLRDVIDPAQTQAFELKEKQMLVNQYAGQLFEESLNEFIAYFATPTAEMTDRYIDDALWYSTPEAIGVFYNPYSIAPYVAGPIAVELLRSDLGSIVIH